ncbi:hypothetical protein [Candidatus Phytoplasma sacchari]|uniref:Uncharacterized protein n=1 Tax=Candidatus Phytoplasma sacchari TaxID=2609813 RepID=A0ABY7M395_9MOLU|nr:hypothetical protein O7R10_01745 [Candidatus Phytoplasma sacchari]
MYYCSLSLSFTAKQYLLYLKESLLSRAFLNFFLKRKKEKLSVRRKRCKKRLGERSPFFSFLKLKRINSSKNDLMIKKEKEKKKKSVSSACTKDKAF